MTNEQQKQLAAAFQTSAALATKGLKGSDKDRARREQIDRAFKQAATKALIALLGADVEIDASMFIHATVQDTDVDHVYNR